MDRCLMRLLCTFLTVLLVCQEAFAGVEGATASDAAPVYVDGSGGGSAGSGLLAKASEEELERYYQSFVDYPVTLLEWPEGVPQPRFAIEAVGAAAIWVLKVLLVSVGIYVGVEITKEVWALLQNYETYLRMLGDAMLLDSWEAILKAQWGMAVTGMALQYGKLKQFMREEVQGYGTDAPHYTVISGAVTMSAGDCAPAFGIYSGLRVITSSLPVYPYVCVRTAKDGTKSYHLMLVSSASFTYAYNLSGNGSDASALEGTGYFYTYSQACYDNGNELFDMYPVLDLGFAGISSYVALLVSGELVPGAENSLAVTPARSWADLQREYYDEKAMADTINVPVDQSAADEIEANVAAAADAAGVEKALEKAWGLGQLKEGTGEGEDTYPWIPSITRWLEGIKSGIDSIKEKVMSIPDTLAKILDGILAIPGQIADFFTLDTAVISNEFASLQDVFAAKFAGISLLADVFTKSYSFGTEVPVFTAPVPDTLRELFGGQPEIVIMDLRPHTELFLQLRSLLVAMFWVAFAKWLLDQFDVKFHVG